MSTNTTEKAGTADGDAHDTTCTDRWKAALSNILK